MLPAHGSVRPPRHLSRIRRLPADLLDFIYPPACVLCSEPPGTGATICPRCEGHLVSLPHPVCPHCRRFIAVGATACPRGHVTSPFPVWAAGLFDDHYRRLILAFKFRARRDCGDFLGARLAQIVATDPRGRDIAAVVPVPLHPARLRERGFNQSELLAHRIAARLERPLVPEALQRRRNTRTQTSLDIESRRRNVNGAFAPSGKPPAGRTVLLVDDVLTTGATLDACAQALQGAGVRRVLGAVVALAEFGVRSVSGRGS